MKTLKEYGVELSTLKKEVKALNDVGILSEKIKVTGKGPEILARFLVTISELPDAQLESIPKSVNDFYESLPQAVFDDLGADLADDEAEETEDDAVETEEVEETAEPEDNDEAEEEVTEPEEDEPVEEEKKVNKKGKKDKKSKKAEKEETGDETEEGDNTEGSTVTSDCPAFKTGCNPDEDDCKNCADEFPDEFAACKEGTEKKAKKKAKKAARKKGGTPRKPKLRTRYGHIVGTMSGDIDNLLWEGGPIAEMAETIAKKHKREVPAAQAKIRGHIKHLMKNKGIEVTNEDDVLKAVQEFAEGYTAENTK